MLRSSTIFVLILGLMLMFAFNGCIFDSPEEAVEEPEQQPESQLDMEFGGYTTSDEAAAFGDHSLAKDFQEDENVTDLLQSDPTVKVALESDSVKVYFLRITWGRLQWDSTATEMTDWSGSASINKGTLVVLRKIRFEREDKLIRPRPNRKTIEWQSYTQPHFDGLALAIIDNDTTTDAAGQFNITAGAYSGTFAFSELDSMELTESVGSDGNEICIISRSKEVVPFAGGFLEGRWIRVDSTHGVFHGRWMNSIGAHAGFVKGIWGINRRGLKVLFGKWISLNGHFKGLLAGHWDYRDDQNKGVFEGHWVNRSLTHAGNIKGVWKAGEVGSRKGYFKGRYRTVR